MASFKQQDNPTSTATVIIVLAILSCAAFGEKLKFCEGGKPNNRSELEKLRDCDVIGGHLIFSFNILNSSKEWNEFGSLKVREITDFLIFFMVDNLRSLNTLLPNLSVIRGRMLYSNYALVVYGNSQLEELKLSNLTAILSGSVFIESNKALNGYVNKIDWYRITYWNYRHCAHPNIIQASNHTRSCNKTCKVGDKDLGTNSETGDEFCWSADECQKREPTGEPCHEQCVGGCFVPGSDEACVACKGFRYLSDNKCRSSCGSLYELANYVCVTDDECSKLGLKQREILVNTIEGDSVQTLCVKECPNGFQEIKNNTSSKIICKECKAGGCTKKCEGGLIDSISGAQKYQECTIVEGYLEIILFGANLTGELQKYLGNIEVVSGYVRVFKSVALPSLHFFKKLRSIEGQKLWKRKYSLIVNDNDELQELWHNDAFTLQKGEALFYANPKLCPQIIETLLSKNKWKEQFPALNGNKKSCFVNDKLVLLLKPLDTGKGVMSVKILGSSFSKEVLYRMAGFHVYYKLSDSEKRPVMEDKLQMGQSSSSIPSAWSVHFQEYTGKISTYLETVITGLEPAKNFIFYIETLTVNTDDNTGSFQSKPFVAATLPYYPSEPVSVTYSGSKTYTQVRWSPPLETNGVIHHYEVSVVPYKEEQKKVNMCPLIETKNDSLLNLNEGVTGEGTEAPALRPTSLTSTCVSKAQNPGERRAEDKGIIDKLENFINRDLTMSGRFKRDTSLTDYRESQSLTVSSKSGIRKSLDPRKTLSMLTSPQKDLQNETLQLDWGQYYYSLNLTVYEVCSLLKEIYEEDPRMSPNPFYLLVCGKLEDSPPEPAIDDRNTIYESFVNRRKRSIGERKKIAVTLRDDSYVVKAMDYGGSYNMTYLKVNSSYLVKIKACHKPIAGTPRCTGSCKCSNETYIVVHALPDDEDFRVQNLAIDPGKGDSITVKWLPPKIPIRANLAYRIDVKGPDGLRSFCEISSYKTLNLSASGNYIINVTAFSEYWSQNFSMPSEIQYSFNNAATISAYTQKHNMSVIYAASFFVAVFLLLAIILLFRRGKKNEIPLSNFIENPGYIIMHPTMKEYLYDKIPIEKLYSKKGFKRTGLAGQGKFGIVYKGALWVTDGTNKKKFIPVAAKQLLNPMFIDIERRKHFRVNEKKNQGGYNESRVQTEEYEANNQDNELINPQQINNQDIELTKQLIDEASLMLTLKSFHLVRTYGVMCENYELSIIMELMTNENLSSHLKKQKRWGNAGNLISLEQVIKFGIQIADGMAYLSEKGVVHRDLAARNCLLDSHFNVKVSDFGMARVMQDNIYMSTGENKPIPVRWMPPEYFKEEKFVTNSDVYSYGILLWEIVNPGEIPYREVKMESIVQSKVAAGVTLIQSIPRWVPKTLHELIGKCWHYTPEYRPSFRDIVTQLLKFTSDKFKEDFKKASFYHCGEMPEYELEETYYPVPPIDDDYVDPSTPLTTPTAEGAFADLETSDFAQHDSSWPFLRSVLIPFQSFRNFWRKPRDRHRYLRFFSLTIFLSSSESKNTKQSSVNLPSNKPDVLPITTRTIPEDQSSRRQMEFA